MRSREGWLLPPATSLPSVSITAAAICVGLSTTFHTLRSHSYDVHHRWGRFDILGICLLALGGGSSATYCDPTAQDVCWGLNSSAILPAAVVLFDTGGGGSRMRALRGGTFGALALTAMLPIFNGIGKLGWNRACTEIGAQWYLAEGLVLLFGFSMFVGRLPERLSPGSFDVLGSLASDTPYVCRRRINVSCCCACSGIQVPPCALEVLTAICTLERPEELVASTSSYHLDKHRPRVECQNCVICRYCERHS
jgi:predicted membrane channel-forming protein YqfA (hemolysin III family)